MTKKPIIGIEERLKIQAFLNHFLFIQGGVYSLFGDKPITEIFIFIGGEADLMPLTEEQLKTALFYDHSLADNWRAWKRFTEKLHTRRFIFAEHPCNSDPSQVTYLLLNVKRVKEVLEKHRLAFQSKTGYLFDTDKVIEEFRNPTSLFWEQAFSDHYLAGLLYGYGEENISNFLDHNQDGKRESSDQYDPFATAANFPIPRFAVSAQDKTSARYREQRKTIQAVYQDKDIVDVTIRHLLE
jgi:hypothetical protein